LADQTIGFIQGMFTEITEIPDTELERLMAIAGQAAIAVQSRLLLEQAQTRAQQEQRIREVTAQVFEAVDVQTIMRRAVEQVGRTLGMPAYIYLGSDHSPREITTAALDAEELP
jgi:GAF domain-containing protein